MGREGEPPSLFRVLVESIFKLQRGQPWSGQKFPRYFLKSFESRHGDLSPHLSSSSILEFSVAFLPTCFQFALVACIACDLNPIRKETGGGGGARGKTSRRGIERSAERRGRERIEAGVGAFKKIDLLIHAEAAAEWLLNFSVDREERKCEWIKKFGGVWPQPTRVAAPEEL